MATLPQIIIKQELRPCIVDGKKALFHKLDTEERVMLKAGTFMRPEEADSIGKEIKKRAAKDKFVIFPNYLTPHKVSVTQALVEYEDGTMERVQPEQVRFIDTQAHMDGIAWPEHEEE